MTGKRTQRFWGAAALLTGVALLAGTLTVANAEDKGEKPLRGPKAEQRDDKGPRQFDGQRRPGGGPMMGVLRDMDLTDDQKQKLQSIHQEARKARQAWQEQHKDQIEAIRAEMRALQEKLRALHATAPGPEAHLDQVRDVLTVEQREVFDQRIAEMKERREDRGPHMHMGPKPAGPRPDAKKGEGKKELDL